MFDDTDVALLPSGYTAYAGYVDGIYANVSAIRSRFPGAHVLAIDVNASNIGANCLDVEPGDATNAAALVWTKAKLSSRTGTPVLYTSAGNAQSLINVLAAGGVSRSQYLLWSAHYNGVEHICGQDGYPQADGTQFTDTAMGRSLDESEVNSSFFGSPVTTTFPIKLGQSGTDVATVQGWINKWAKEIGLGTLLKTDGSFGLLTEVAVKLALVYWHYSAANVAKGEVDQSLWDHLKAAIPAPPAPPKPVPYPAPAGLAVSPSVSVTLSWKPSVLSGKAATSYTVALYSSSGSLVSDKTVTGTSTTLTLMHGRQYEIHVWANGGPVAPPHATVTFTA
jgi:hypothetical protein